MGGGCLTKKTQQSFCNGTNSKSGMWVITRPSVSGSDTLCLPLVFSNILIIMCYFALVHHLKTKPPVSYLKFCLFNLCVFVSHSAGTLTKRTQRNMKQKVRYVKSLSEKIDFECSLQPDHPSTSCAGQMHLWNPDEPSTPRGSVASLSACLEERLREACGELAIPWTGCAGHAELLALCEHLGLEVRIKINRWPCFISLVCLNQFIEKSIDYQL